MIADLLRRLAAPTSEPMPEPDARLALAALLVRLARADDNYEAVERERIDRAMMSRYGLNAADAASLRSEAETVEADAPDTVRFTKAIKDGVDYDDRIGVVEAMWDVVLADGVRDEDENAMMRMVPPMLGVNDRDSNMARKRVETRRNA
ncbi:Tellurite resistance protein TerB [Rhodobacteraceae bacterium THAF1]|uniref:tellurite resistance TerB family protein n=1 Tax=Palleronia sp. THAF1 TaxID=2587842 RepID=UPI000F400A70|nr:TerB family tellurite resistance protein [Palleronia sp. THAF1]QFU07434.1 Tellurite resistance protein TerB [Palleronia sp. THAF1]VDC20654.1 Tellurite resistance protein TerB [Rhodobacteraceae bacterium THAF1]